MVQHNPPCLLAALAGSTYAQSIIIDEELVGVGCTIEGAEEGRGGMKAKITSCVFCSLLWLCSIRDVHLPLNLLEEDDQGFPLQHHTILSRRLCVSVHVCTIVLAGLWVPVFVY